MIDEIISLRMEWRTVCAMACKALCHGVTFDRMCEMALRDFRHGYKASDIKGGYQI